MATQQQIIISAKSLDALKIIVKKGKITADGFDKRSIRALTTRKLVKTSGSLKKGLFVAPTAAGKKFLN